MRLSIAFILFFTAFQASAQDYHTGIGLRGGPSSGITVKHFIKSNTAIEGIFSTRWGGWNVTGLYEINKAFKGADRLNWYYGVGAHLGSWNGDRNPWFTGNENHLVIGADVILGMEYNFKEIPINISVDFKPGFNLIGYTGLWADEGALSIRYIF